MHISKWTKVIILKPDENFLEADKNFVFENKVSTEITAT